MAFVVLDGHWVRSNGRLASSMGWRLHSVVYCFKGSTVTHLNILHLSLDLFPFHDYLLHSDHLPPDRSIILTDSRVHKFPIPSAS